MPIYEYWCEKCQGSRIRQASIAERRNQKCAVCGEPMELKVGAPEIVTFCPRYFENLPEPKYVSSRSELREECRRQGVACDEAFVNLDCRH